MLSTVGLLLLYTFIFSCTFQPLVSIHLVINF